MSRELQDLEGQALRAKAPTPVGLPRFVRCRVPLLALATAACTLAPQAARAEGGLRILPDPTTLTVLIVVFLVLVPLLNRLLFRPLFAVLDERERRIEGAHGQAVELARETAALVQRHEDSVRAVREQAHGERAQQVEAARNSHRAAIAEARRTAETAMNGTRADVAGALERAREALRAEAEPLAREVAARLLGRSLG